MRTFTPAKNTKILIITVYYFARACIWCPCVHVCMWEHNCVVGGQKSKLICFSMFSIFWCRVFGWTSQVLSFLTARSIERYCDVHLTQMYEILEIPDSHKHVSTYKCFTHWAISPALILFFLNRSVSYVKQLFFTANRMPGFHQRDLWPMMLWDPGQF